jgi:hypothetical protein
LLTFVVLNLTEVPQHQRRSKLYCRKLSRSLNLQIVTAQCSNDGETQPLEMGGWYTCLACSAVASTMQCREENNVILAEVITPLGPDRRSLYYVSHVLDPKQSFHASQQEPLMAAATQ